MHICLFYGYISPTDFFFNYWFTSFLSCYAREANIARRQISRS